jgi:hypothetical protein
MNAADIKMTNVPEAKRTNSTLLITSNAAHVNFKIPTISLNQSGY